MKAPNKVGSPIGFIGHRDGYWAIIWSPEVGKKEHIKCVAQCLELGCEVTAYLTREDYSAAIGNMKMWSDRPEDGALK